MNATFLASLSRWNSAVNLDASSLKEAALLILASALALVIASPKESFIEILPSSSMPTRISRSEDAAARAGAEPPPILCLS